MKLIEGTNLSKILKYGYCAPFGGIE